MTHEGLDHTHIVVGCKSWNRRVFDEVISKYSDKCQFVGFREELATEALRALNPRYVFFVHWSWKVADEITNNYECVCFHMANVPYGRGGSPLQNLIVRGHRHTKLTALRMTKDFDAGPLYLKEDLVAEISPEVIYTHHGSDLNIDHQVVHRAVLTATRPIQGCSVRKIYAFEIPSSTDWSFQQFQPAFYPNVFVGVSTTMEKKIQAIKIYESEIRGFPHPRSPKAIQAVARCWGSVVGYEAAEAFELVHAIR